MSSIEANIYPTLRMRVSRNSLYIAVVAILSVFVLFSVGYQLAANGTVLLKSL